MEPSVFTSYNVPRLKASSRVNGILLRYYDNDTSQPDDIEYFSAERKCPNRGFGIEGCADDMPWNNFTNGTSLSFTDFGDFPIFALPNHTFTDVLECYEEHNTNGDGGIIDYPLCAAEMVADMLTAKDTETCFRRGDLLTNQVNGVQLCDPLGDQNVWGSIFNLTEERLGRGAIMLATKLDSIAFFPYLSWGANNELAGVATLMAVLETIGNLKREGNLTQTDRPILFAFFHGESWDYIGSSRMIYDMEQGLFPDFDPKFSHDVITDYLELTNLGLYEGDPPITYYHSITSSPLLETLIDLAANASNLNLSASTREDLPVASLQRFLRRNASFSGVVLSDFNNVFRNKFYGSRYDNVGNFNDSTLDSVAQQLADLASLITEAVVIQARGNSDPDNYTANPETIKNILTCFLVGTDCELFQSVLTHDRAQELEPKPLHRYISVDTTINSETIITYALAASFTGVRLNSSDGSETMPCSECSDLAQQLSEEDSQVTVVQQQYNGSSDLCYCVKSFVHNHTAVSPAFVEKDYSSHEYSTWVESRWRFINLRIYLVTYRLQEVAFFFCGLAMIFITLLVAVQGSRKSNKIFRTLSVAHSPLHLTAADRQAPPEPVDVSDSELSDSFSPQVTRDQYGGGGSATNIQ
jgi:nicastrin